MHIILWLWTYPYFTRQQIHIITWFSRSLYVCNTITHHDNNDYNLVFVCVSAPRRNWFVRENAKPKYELPLLHYDFYYWWCSCWWGCNPFQSVKKWDKCPCITFLFRREDGDGMCSTLSEFGLCSSTKHCILIALLFAGTQAFHVNDFIRA